jgi:hypothetical protein
MRKHSEYVWAAGIIEGEGYFGTTKANGSDKEYVRFAIAMTDRDVIERLRKVLGWDNSISEGQARGRGGNKTFYRMDAGGKKVMLLAMCIYPYMGKRRRETIAKLWTTYQRTYKLW